MSFVVEELGSSFHLNYLVYWHLFCQSDFCVFICIESSHYQFKKKNQSFWLATTDFLVVLFYTPTSLWWNILLYTCQSISIPLLSDQHLKNPLYDRNQTLFTDTLKNRWYLLILKSQCQISRSNYSGHLQVNLLTSH